LFTTSGLEYPLGTATGDPPEDTLYKVNVKVWLLLLTSPLPEVNCPW
jgi:hypothetical protein